MNSNLNEQQATLLQRDQRDDELDRYPSQDQSRVRRAVILIAIAILAVPILIVETPREIARWHAAAAAEKFANGDTDGAFATLDKAIDWDPKTDGLYRVRGNWRLDLDDVEGALADFNQAVEISPDEPVNYVDRSMALQQLGRHREAVDDWNKIVELNEGQDLLILHRFLKGQGGIMRVYNSRAYARALANIELDQALKDIERAMSEVGADGDNAAYLDTRGFIHYLRGDLNAAKTDLDAAVQKAEQALAKINLRELGDSVDYFKQIVAVIRYHRALVYQGLNESESAEEDIKRVKALGFEPNDRLF